jgi:hypothetical protein
MDEMRLELFERPDRARLRYWAWLLKLLREPWPPRFSVPARSSEPPRLDEPKRQPAPARLGDEA